MFYHLIHGDFVALLCDSDAALLKLLVLWGRTCFLFVSFLLFAVCCSCRRASHSAPAIQPMRAISGVVTSRACPRFKTKTARANNAKLGTHTRYGRRSACVDP